MPIKFQPLGPRCLVKPIDKAPESTIIVTAEAFKGKSDEGVVLAMGTEPFGFRKADNNAGQLVQLKIGDVVLFQKYTGSEFRLGGTDCRVLAYDDLLGIISQVPDAPKIEPPPIPNIVTPATIVSPNGAVVVP